MYKRYDRLLGYFSDHRGLHKGPNIHNKVILRVKLRKWRVLNLACDSNDLVTVREVFRNF